MKTNTLAPTSPANCLDLINQAVNAIAKKSEQVSANHIIKQCNEGKAFAFTDLQHDTLVVLEPIALPILTINVWVAYSRHGNAIKEYEPEIERLARQIGAKSLTFSTQRRGYSRAMPHWVKTKNTYKRQLI